MTTQPHVRSLSLTLVVDGFDVTPHPTTFDTFVVENDLSDEEAEELAMALLEEGAFHGGGGSAPHYSLRVAP